MMRVGMFLLILTLLIATIVVLENVAPALQLAEIIIFVFTFAVMGMLWMVRVPPVIHVWKALILCLAILFVQAFFPLDQLVGTIARGIGNGLEAIQGFLESILPFSLGSNWRRFFLRDLLGQTFQSVSSDGNSYFRLALLQIVLLALVVFAMSGLGWVLHKLMSLRFKYTGSEQGATEFGANLIGFLRKKPVHWGFKVMCFATALMFTGLAPLLGKVLNAGWELPYPVISLVGGSVSDPDPLNKFAFGVLWLGLALVFMQLALAGLPVDVAKGRTWGRSALSLRNREVKLQPLAKKLAEAHGNATLASGQQVARKPVSIPDFDAMPDTTWAGELVRELHDLGYGITPQLANGLQVIQAELLNNDAPIPLALNETLIEQKILIISAMLRHFRDRGESVLIIVDRDRQDHVVEMLRAAELQITSAIGSHWHGLADTSRPENADSVVFGTVDDIDQTMFKEETVSGMGASPLASVLDRLGAVFILEAQGIDLAQLQLKLALLRSSLGDAAYARLRFLLQAEPMEAFESGLTNTFFGHVSGSTNCQLVELAPERDSTSHVVVLNYDTEYRPDFNVVDDSMPMISRAVDIVVGADLPAFIIDADHTEPEEIWQTLNKKHKSERGDVEFDPVCLTGMPSDDLSGKQPRVYLEHDGGHLARALSRDLCAPRGGKDENEVIAPEALLAILSEPTPYRGYVLDGLNKGRSSIDIQTVFCGPDLKRYLPMVPNIAPGPAEMLSDLAYQFMAAKNQTLTEPQIRQTIMKYFEVGHSWTDWADGRGDRFRVDMTAHDLATAFRRVFSIGVSLEDIKSGHHERRIQATDSKQLARVVNGERLIFKVPGSTTGRLNLRGADYGQLVANGSSLRMKRGVYTVKESGKVEGYDRKFELTTTQSSSPKDYDSAMRDTFRHAYRADILELVEGSPREGQVLKMMRLYARMNRKTLERLPLQIASAAAPNFTERVHDVSRTWFSHVGLIAFDHPAEQDVVRALCLTLQYLLKQKFPSVGHAIAVVSPQAMGSGERLPYSMHDFSMSETMSQLLRARYSDGLCKDGQGIELFVIEDADHGLGVVSSLLLGNNFDGGGLAELWTSFTEYCSRENGTPFSGWTNQRLGCDFDGAADLLKEVFG